MAHHNNIGVLQSKIDLCLREIEKRRQHWLLIIDREDEAEDIINNDKDIHMYYYRADRLVAALDNQRKK